MTVPQEIVGLVERFEEQRESYRSGEYKEAQLRILADSEECAAPISDHHKTVLQRQIETTDNQIDQLVYELYGVTEGDIALIKKQSRSRCARLKRGRKRC